MSIEQRIKELEDLYQFNYRIISRLSFFYGIAKTESLIKALKTHTKNYSIRTNTLQTTTEELTKALNEKDIKALIHPDIQDAILIPVEGPITIQRKEKTVSLRYHKANNRVLVGSSLGAKDFFLNQDLEVNDEVSVVDKKNEVIANGIVMMRMDEIREKKKGVAIKITECPYIIPNLVVLKEYLRGHFIPDPLPSIITAKQVKLKPKDRLLDFSVGSGEILTHIWQNNSKVPDTRIIAIDESATRFQKLEENIKRLRMYKAPIENMNLDFSGIANKLSKNETFDWIIIHPLTSEIGVRPKIFEEADDKTIIKYNRLLRKYIQEAARLIKQGGTILYFTESIDPDENENVIRFAVEELNLRVEKQDIFIGSSCSANFEGAELLQYFYPDEQDISGAFIARLTK
ncbi:MAG: hypothetical protein FK734_05235 [Asgard group archaeon]|nr:hypothetical protein [Asgard group archaeon]